MGGQNVSEGWDFDLTPDPRVLVALTQTPLAPLDALCELIDNSLDSFAYARLRGQAVDYPLIAVDLPGPSELDRPDALIRIRDNGPGLPARTAEMALKAGYSGNKNPYDSLGLFGMGFNISTGKLGIRTRFMTLETGSTEAVDVEIDLMKLVEQHDFRVHAKAVKPPPEFLHGTIIEISQFWPAGNANSGFVRSLINYGKPTIRREIGRRYATILRRNDVRIVVNGDPCESHEHCVWSASRSVERQGWGQIPARFDLDQVLGTQLRCTECNTLLAPGMAECPTCESASSRTIEERVHGWVGIQRFDDQTRFGIDLIRNGRAIRIGEQEAFFSFEDDLKRKIKDYPIDSSYGRIVGELHLDHVPVDFLKQDFQRNTAEWRTALDYLRGRSSLQPQHWPDGQRNESPVSKLFQGFRRVRVAGARDMYMGYWDTETGRPKRVSRDVEKEYYEKFTERVPGYRDDAEWWKLVEQADHKPVEELVECPQCHSDNLRSAEVCAVCEHILIGKTCVNPDCTKEIAVSVLICPHCEQSQIPEIEEPWLCPVCSQLNGSDDESCGQCGSPRGTASPGSREYLAESSDKDDDLSVPGCSIRLADGTNSAPTDVDVYITRGPIVPAWGQPAVPIVVFKGEKIEVFLDRSHVLFRTYRVRPEEAVASEVAQYLYVLNQRLVERYPSFHSLSNISWQVIQQRWAETLEDSPDRVSEDIRSLFELIREKLPRLVEGRAEDLFDELTEVQKRALLENMLGEGVDPAKLGDMRPTGEFLWYIDELTAVDMFRRYPAIFFDGAIWSNAYESLPELEDALVVDVQAHVRSIFLNCLEDCAAFLRYRVPEGIITHRARASVEFLTQKLA